MGYCSLLLRYYLRAEATAVAMDSHESARRVVATLKGSAGLGRMEQSIGKMVDLSAVDSRFGE